MTTQDLGIQVLAAVAPVVVSAVGIAGTAALMWLRRRWRVDAVAAERELVRSDAWHAAAAVEEQAARLGRHGPSVAGDDVAAAAASMHTGDGLPVLTGEDKAALVLDQLVALHPGFSRELLVRVLDSQLVAMAGVGATGPKVIAPPAFADAGKTDPQRPTGMPVPR